MEAGKYHFIIVDDNDIDILIASKMIELSGNYLLSTHSFNYAKYALDFMQNNNLQPTPVIVLLDIQMPRMNGFQFMDEFEKLPEDIRKKYAIYFLTSSVNENDKIRATKYPSVAEYINKPFTQDTLLNLIRNIQNK